MPHFGAVQPIVPPRFTIQYFTQQQMSNLIILGTGYTHIIINIMPFSCVLYPINNDQAKRKPTIVVLQGI
eukprot:13960571-Ditylum_brightwellii.AAC.1